MSGFLVYGDSYRSAEIRHEVPLPIVDPFLFVATESERHVVVGSLEVPRLRGCGFVVHPYEEFGLDELVARGASRGDALRQVAVEAVIALGVTGARVSETFPLWLGDRLRERGTELHVDPGFFADRRRVKSDGELAGIRRAQDAGHLAMQAVVSLLGRAEIRAGVLVSDGGPLTSDAVRAAIRRALVALPVAVDDFIAAGGGEAASVHSIGHGPLPANASIVVDIWPRDLASGCYGDMTRTFVVGRHSDTIARWHELCLIALERCIAEIRPGVETRELHAAACDVFESAGEPTVRLKRAGEPLETGFFHSLGHGVGLDGHEPPYLSLSSHEKLQAGDVVALEPGCYDAAAGGVRVEDLVLVTATGCERLTRFPYDLVVPSRQPVQRATAETSRTAASSSDGSSRQR